MGSKDRTVARKARAFGVACLALAATSAAAQAIPLPGRMVGLTEFLREVVRTNPSVREARLQWLISTGQARAEWGLYEPAFDGSYQQDGLRQQNTSLQQFQQLGQQVYDQKNDAFTVGVGGALPTGATYNLKASVTRLQDTYVEQGQFQSFVGVTANQPLLKGFTNGAPFASIRTAFEDRIIAFHEYRRQIAATVSQAETAYWNLAFAQEVSRMSAASVKVAQDLLEVSKAAASAGRMSDLDVRQAESELSARKSAQEDSDLSLNESQRQLRLLLGDQSDLSKGTIVAADPIVSDGAGSWDPGGQTDALLEWARRAQPDYMIASEQAHRESILVGYQKDQALPELNLTGSYGYSGLGTTPQDSLSSLQTQAYPNWTVGVELKVPLLLGVRQRNNLEVEQLKSELASVRLQATGQQMEDAIASLARSVGTLLSHIENQRAVAEAKSHLLDVQNAGLRAGTASLLDVYGAEDALRQAQQAELDAVVRYRQAMMDLERTSGTVLRDNDLEKLQDGQVVLDEELRTGSH
ncbi:MAG TPA: TolC family protein [Spirochaetia bacterium]|nr:TolC family protein [Spirochaetia bacterium]